MTQTYTTMWEASKRPDTMAIRRKRKPHPRKVKRGELTHVVNRALRQTLARLTEKRAQAHGFSCGSSEPGRCGST